MYNILRVIKSLHFYERLENLTTEEKLFFQLQQNLHKNELGELCNEYNKWVVRYDFENGYFWYSYNRFYLVFKEKFDINIQHFNALCTNILETQLNCKELTPRRSSIYC